MRLNYMLISIATFGLCLADPAPAANPEPAPKNCKNRHHVHTQPRIEEPTYYVMNSDALQYPFAQAPAGHPDYYADVASAAAAQIQSRAPQTPSPTPAPTTSFFGIGSLPSFGSIPSFSALFPVSGSKCNTASGDDGTCLTQGECDNQGGVKDGNCGTILFASSGVCCSFKIQKCSDTAIRTPITWMTPPRASSKISCTLTFPANPGLTVAGTTISAGLTSSSNAIRSCQLKIEFMNFRLSPPNARTTECDEDYFTVVGSAIETPKLCGDSYSDQHMYIPFNNEQEDITLGFFLSDAANKDWKLKISRIACNSQELAPTNCLQYFSKTAGQIESYNFRQEYGGSVRQLADQNYNLCFKRPSGFCKVCFTPCQTYKNVPGFLLTRSAINGTSATTGSSCNDQLIIPGGTSGTNIRESVYCGAALNTEFDAPTDAQICTSSDRITYLTDAMEDPEEEVNNVGFCLSFTQKKC